MPNCSISVQVLPDTPHDKVFEVVDRVIEFIALQNVKYVVCPFETVIEGEFEHLMNILKRTQEIALENGATSVFSNVKISYCPEGVYTIDEKITKYN